MENANYLPAIWIIWFINLGIFCLMIGATLGAISMLCGIIVNLTYIANYNPTK